MPFDVTRYPADWKAFRWFIKYQRAGQRCECTGECGMHTPNPNPRRCVEEHHKPARWFRGKVRLSVAHLCTCDPPCRIDTHVKAMCQRCHLRLDRWKHAKTRQAAPGRIANPKPTPRWHPKDPFALPPQDWRTATLPLRSDKPDELQLHRWHPKILFS